MEKNSPESQIARFLHEAGQLKRVARSGWWAAGVKDPETVAEHSFRAALTAWLLAEMEGADQAKAMAMALFHDLPEARINDAHKVAQRYLDTASALSRAVQDQARSLPGPSGGYFAGLFAEMEEERTLEARVARDADLLECLFQAREYQALGYPVSEWITNTTARLSTPSAKRIAAAAQGMPPFDWWRGPGDGD